MMTSIIAVSLASLLLVSATSKSSSVKDKRNTRCELRASCSQILRDKVASRANRDGRDLAEQTRHYILLGILAEEAITGSASELGTVENEKPDRSRRHIQRYLIDSDLIHEISKTDQAQVSKSEFVNHCIRKELLRIKNDNK